MRESKAVNKLTAEDQTMTNSRETAKAKGITIGEMKVAMQLFAEATDADALRRVTESVIARMEASSEANEIINGGSHV